MQGKEKDPGKGKGKWIGKSRASARGKTRVMEKGGRLEGGEGKTTDCNERA